MNVAAAVRRSKDRDPNRYCTDRRCLWLVVSRDGRRMPCPKHMPGEFVATQITDPGILGRTTFSELWTVTESGADHRHLVTIRTDDAGRETTQCQAHPDGCDAVAAVIATRLSQAMETARQ